jgi:hypothetical protein
MRGALLIVILSGRDTSPSRVDTSAPAKPFTKGPTRAGPRPGCTFQELPPFLAPKGMRK